MIPRAWLMDLDGVVYRGDKAIPGSAEFVAWLQQTRQPFLFLTNHSARTPESFARKLQDMGIAVEPHHILSSAIVTAEFLHRQRRGKRVFVIGEDGLYQALDDRCIPMVEDDPEIVILGFDREISYAKLTRAARFILKGAEFIRTNGDMTYPLEDGPAPECGTLLAAIQGATSRAPLIMGKPEHFMFDEAMRRLGVGKEQTIMVGDRLETDIVGAINFGIASILVLTGVATREDSDRSGIKPDHICPNLAACRTLTEFVG